MSWRIKGKQKDDVDIIIMRHRPENSLGIYNAFIFYNSFFSPLFLVAILKRGGFLRNLQIGSENDLNVKLVLAIILV